jgi:hypothetical protein
MRTPTSAPATAAILRRSARANWKATWNVNIAMNAPAMSARESAYDVKREGAGSVLSRIHGKGIPGVWSVMNGTSTQKLMKTR